LKQISNYLGDDLCIDINSYTPQIVTNKLIKLREESNLANRRIIPLIQQKQSMMIALNTLEGIQQELLDLSQVIQMNHTF